MRFGDAVDEHGRLAAAGTRQQQQRPLRGQHARRCIRSASENRARCTRGAAENKLFFQFRHSVPPVFSVAPYFNTRAPSRSTSREFCRIFVRFMLTRTIVRFIMRVEQKFDAEVTTMTTIGLLITLLGGRLHRCQCDAAHRLHRPSGASAQTPRGVTIWMFWRS